MWIRDSVDTAVVGYLMQKEIDFLGNAVENPVRPFVAIPVSYTHLDVYKRQGHASLVHGELREPQQHLFPGHGEQEGLSLIHI